MYRCPACGEENQDGVAFCWLCNTSFRPVGITPAPAGAPAAPMDDSPALTRLAPALAPTIPITPIPSPTAPAEGSLARASRGRGERPHLIELKARPNPDSWTTRVLLLLILAALLLVWYVHRRRHEAMRRASTSEAAQPLASARASAATRPLSLGRAGDEPRGR